MGQRLREVRAWKRGITSHDGDTLADRNQNLNVFDEQLIRGIVAYPSGFYIGRLQLVEVFNAEFYRVLA